MIPVQIALIRGRAALEEEELLQRMKNRDGQALAALYDRYAPVLYGLILSIVKIREEAEDVLQETFLKAFANLGQFQGASKFYTWLVRIAVNESLMKLRRRKADKLVSLDEPVDLTQAKHIWTSRKLPGVMIPPHAEQWPMEPD